MTTQTSMTNSPYMLSPTFRQSLYKGESIPLVQSEQVTLGLTLGAAMHINPETEEKRFDLCALDLDDTNLPLTTIPMDFLGHGIVPDPVRPELVSVFEKRGPGACEIDLKRGSVTRTITTGDDRQFYGHGAYSPDGSLLYCTETITEGEYVGLIAVRDANTHEYLGEFPSFGSSPHDCHLIDDGKTMVVTNGGGPVGGVAPNVCFIDIASQKLVEKLEFDADHVNAGHLDITPDGKLAVVSAQREGQPAGSLGGISLRLEPGKLHTLTTPEKLIGHLRDESLSVCIHEDRDIVGVTTPDANMLSFWQASTGKLLHYYVVNNPRGIELSLDQRFFIVSYGKGEPAEAMSLISAETLQHVPGYDLQLTGITGSHLTAYAFPQHMRA